MPEPRLSSTICSRGSNPLPVTRTELLEEQAATIGDLQARAESYQEIQRKLSEDTYLITANFPEGITVANGDGRQDRTAGPLHRRAGRRGLGSHRPQSDAVTGYNPRSVAPSPVRSREQDHRSAATANRKAGSIGRPDECIDGQGAVRGDDDRVEIKFGDGVDRGRQVPDADEQVNNRADR